MFDQCLIRTPHFTSTGVHDGHAYLGPLEATALSSSSSPSPRSGDSSSGERRAAFLKAAGLSISSAPSPRTRNTSQRFLSRDRLAHCVVSRFPPMLLSRCPSLTRKSARWTRIFPFWQFQVHLAYFVMSDPYVRNAAEVPAISFRRSRMSDTRIDFCP